jgi:hypothetical protein
MGLESHAVSAQWAARRVSEYSNVSGLQTQEKPKAEEDFKLKPLRKKKKKCSLALSSKLLPGVRADIPAVIKT